MLGKGDRELLLLVSETTVLLGDVEINFQLTNPTEGVEQGEQRVSFDPERSGEHRTDTLFSRLLVRVG